MIDMNVDDMVVMMSLLDADGDGKVTKLEFGVYYKRLRDCDDAAFEAIWREIDADGDGILTLNELCNFYGIDTGDCASALKAHKGMNDDRVLEALALQSLVNEARQREEMQRKAHAARLRALSELADEMNDEEEDTAPSPTVVTSKMPAASPMTMQELTRMSKARGDLAPHHFERL